MKYIFGDHQKNGNTHIVRNAVALVMLAAWLLPAPVFAGKDNPCKGPPADRDPVLCGGDDSGSGGADEENVSCETAFGVTGCDCLFRRIEEVDSGSPPSIAWKLTNHCYTDTTLEIPWFTRLTMLGEFSITAVNDSSGVFNGSSVFSVEGHRAEITESNVIIDVDVDTGCGNGKLNSAFQLLLTNSSPNPFLDEPDWWDEALWWPWNSYPNTWWTIRSNTVTAPAGKHLCTLVEAGHAAGQYNFDIVERISVGGIVSEVAYEDAAIWLHHVGPEPGNGGIEVGNNTIAPVGGTPPTSAAIAIGPFKGEVEIKNNNITLEAGTAIQLFDGNASSTASVHHNDVMGGYRGVVGDSSISSLTVNSNDLDGDNSTSSQGICSEAASGRIRANKIRNYQTEIATSNCN